MCDFVGGILRITAAVVEEVTDVVGAEHFQQALIFGAVLVQPLEFVTTRTKRAGRRVAQGRDIGVGLLRCVDEVFSQRANDAVASGIDRADAIAVLARGLDDATGRSVDHGGHAARLRVERVAFLHSHCMVPMY